MFTWFPAPKKMHSQISIIFTKKKKMEFHYYNDNRASLVEMCLREIFKEEI